jgi:23S rRNA (pseudouridine1915-N3)-methyltransferase
MLPVEIWWIGKFQFPYVKDATDDYIKRLKHYCKLSIREFAGHTEAKLPVTIKIKEENVFRKALDKENADIVLLDEQGKNFTSLEFANWVNDKQIHSGKKIIFIIGGPYGFSASLKTTYPSSISFGLFTYSHQIMRILILEQLYRAFTIIQNKPYHNE